MPFFSALNPMSENSGITYRFAPGTACQDLEMMDASVTEGIYNAFYKDEHLLDALSSTHTIIMGCHYDLSLRGCDDARGGSKGVLDFLIFPLIARKLVADTWLDERRESPYVNLLALMISLPLEITRLVLGITLTILLSPFVLLMHAIKMWTLDPDVRRGRMAGIHGSVGCQPADEKSERIDPCSNQEKIEHLSLKIPDQYECSLTLQIITDPVFIKSDPMVTYSDNTKGPRYYERSWLEDCIKTKGEHPTSGESLSLDGIESSPTMKLEIDAYVKEQLQLEHDVSHAKRL